MTALAADRDTPQRDGVQYEYPAAADVEFFAGALVCLNTSGNAEPMTEATGKICVGRCEEYLDTTGLAAAAKKVKVRAGVFKYVNGETITKAHIGDVLYASDDQTLMRTSTGRSAVGACVDVESDGVWVSINAPLAAPTVGLLAANNLSDLGSAATARTNLGFDAHTGVITSMREVSTVAASAYTVDTDDGDAVILAAADNDVVTLPDAAAGNKGLRVTVIATGDDGSSLVSVSPHSSDSIFGTIPNAAADSVASGVADKDLQLTKATMNKGDYVVLVSDGSTGWFIVGGVGIWASES